MSCHSPLWLPALDKRGAIADMTTKHALDAFAGAKHVRKILRGFHTLKHWSPAILWTGPQFLGLLEAHHQGTNLNHRQVMHDADSRK